MTASELLRRMVELLNPDSESGDSDSGLVEASAESEDPGAEVETEWKPGPEETTDSDHEAEPVEAAESDSPGEGVSSRGPDASEPGDSSLRQSPRVRDPGRNVVTGEELPEMPEGGFWTPMSGGPWTWR